MSAWQTFEVDYTKVSTHIIHQQTILHFEDAIFSTTEFGVLH